MASRLSSMLGSGTLSQRAVALASAFTQTFEAKIATPIRARKRRSWKRRLIDGTLLQAIPMRQTEASKHQ
jgi:hypothetical protein